MSPMTATSGWPGSVQSGATRSARRDRAAPRARRRAGSDERRRPTARCRRAADAVDPDASASIRSIRTSVCTSTPSSASSRAAWRESSGVNGVSSAVAPLEEHDAGLVGADVVEVGPHDVARQISASAPASSTPVGRRPRPRRSGAPLLVGIGRRARPPRGQQHPPPHLQGVVESLGRGRGPASRRGRSSWCGRPPRRSGGRRRSAAPSASAHRARRQIDAGHLGQQHVDVAVAVSTERIG